MSLYNILRWVLLEVLCYQVQITLYNREKDIYSRTIALTIITLLKTLLTFASFNSFLVIFFKTKNCLL